MRAPSFSAAILVHLFESFIFEENFQFYLS